VLPGIWCGLDAQCTCMKDVLGTGHGPADVTKSVNKSKN